MQALAEPKRQPEFPTDSPKPSKILRSENTKEQEEGGSMGQRYLFAVEYVGTRFFGSQKQPDRRTVVGTLEEAFQKFVGQPVTVSSSSRTDAGVHALGNTCHVDVERISKRKPGEVLTPHEPMVVRRAVNHFLQKEGDIMLTDVRCVPRDFHARFKAIERTYFYRLFSGPEPLSIFEKDRAWHVNEELDILLMKKACSILVGTHDFSSFRASGCQALSPIKTLDELHICEVIPSLYFPSDDERKSMDSESSIGCLVASQTNIEKFNAQSSQEFGQTRSHRCYVITARARSFLYHQVRLLVGMLKVVGTGEQTISDVERILDVKSVTATPPMAPSCGLYLGNVKYDL
ncbi:uncharacterized protein M6B38_307015 [Iris pallida]|uniref:tRNA pseudouridine synthase n=1 Tax=Iris pallida TaxID=29817 RepID=A0AAX6HKS5_IRIPA|nr:uncharacterized protein M6B38_307015 [Iris pallida]